MKLLLSMPAGSEWIFLILVLCFFIMVPIAAIYYYSKSKRLFKELESMSEEKNRLLAKLLEKA